jgi:hypothetical protein
LDYLDTHAAFSRVGTDGRIQVSTGGFAAAVFGHRTSRAGDPQLHSHALVINKVQCPDGEWRTIDGHEIYAHKKSAGVVYQAALRNELTRRLGVAWTPVSKDGQAEIAGVPAELRKTWSKRADQVAGEVAPVVAAYEAELGRPLSSAERTAVAKVAVLKTRPDKDPVDIVALRDRWDAEAAALGWDGLALQRSIGAAANSRPALTPAGAEVDRAIADALASAGSRRAVFSRSDLAAEVAARVPAVGITADQVRELVEDWTDRALASPVAVMLRPQIGGPARASDHRYASRTTLAAELQLLQAADLGRGQRIAAISPSRVRSVAQEHGLDASQQAALVQVASRGDAISVLVAPAGTGKTTALGAVVAAWQSAGYRLILLAPSARAAAELRDATGIPADTAAKFLWDQAHPPPPDPFRWNNDHDLGPRDVMIIDEASMLPTADLHALAQLTSGAAAKLFLVGDPAQIGAVDAAGGMLPALAERLDAPTLETVHRFTETWERDASLRLRHGDTSVIEDYRAAGRVHDCPDESAAYRAVLEQYVDAATTGWRALMLARTHRDVDELNELARGHAIETGQVRGPVVLDGNVEWRVGDRLRATRNDRSISVGGDYLRNGDQFTVIGGDCDSLIVQVIDSGQTARLPADYVEANTAYGWASTIDAAQGATIDAGILLARPGIDRQHLYVGMTRGRHSNHVHVAQSATEVDRHTPQRPDDVRMAADVLADALRTSDAQHAAHTRLPGGARIQPPTPRPQVARRRTAVIEPATIQHQRERDLEYLSQQRWSTNDIGRDTGRGR